MAAAATADVVVVAGVDVVAVVLLAAAVAVVEAVAAVEVLVGGPTQTNEAAGLGLAVMKTG